MNSRFFCISILIKPNPSLFVHITIPNYMVCFLCLPTNTNPMNIYLILTNASHPIHHSPQDQNQTNIRVSLNYFYWREQQSIIYFLLLCNTPLLHFRSVSLLLNELFHLFFHCHTVYEKSINDYFFLNSHNISFSV